MFMWGQSFKLTTLSFPIICASGIRDADIHLELVADLSHLFLNDRCNSLELLENDKGLQFGLAYDADSRMPKF